MNLLTWVDDVTGAVPLVDLDSATAEFKRIAKLYNLDYSKYKTRIQTSTNGQSAIPMIKKTSKKLVRRVRKTLEEFSMGKNPANNRKNTMAEVLDGYRLLGAQVGAEEYAEAFLLRKANATREDARMLEKQFSYKQTTLRILK